jgi:hypothetical protein
MNGGLIFTHKDKTISYDFLVNLLGKPPEEEYTIRYRENPVSTDQCDFKIDHGRNEFKKF